MIWRPPLSSLFSYPSFFFFFFNDTATTEIYTLSLHDALPICNEVRSAGSGLVIEQRTRAQIARTVLHIEHACYGIALCAVVVVAGGVQIARSEEHTSELQSLTNLVCRLLLEKKKAHV